MFQKTKKKKSDPDDLPTVQFDSDDGTLALPEYSQTTESTTKTPTIEPTIKIPIFRFPSQSSEKRHKQHSARKSSESKSSRSNHVKAPPLINTQTPELETTSSIVTQKKRLSPAPAFINEIDTPSDMDEEPHSPKKRLKRRQRQLEALKEKMEEEEEDPIIPNDSFSEEDEEDVKRKKLRNIEIAAEDFRKKAAEEKRKKEECEELDQ